MIRLLALGIFLLAMVVSAWPATAQDGEDAADRQVITAQNMQRIGKIATLGYGTVYDVAWSPDGQRLAVATATGLWVYEDLENAPVQFAGIDESVNSVAYSPDGTLLAVGTEDQHNFFDYDYEGAQVWIINVEAEIVRSTLQLSTISELIFHPEGEILLTAGRNGTILWNIDDMSEIKRVQAYSPVALSRDGRYLAGSARRSISVFDLTTEAPTVHSEIEAKAEPVGKIAFNPDATLLAINGELWDVEAQRLLTEFDMHGNISPQFSADGNLLAVGLVDRVEFYDPHSYEKRFETTWPDEWNVSYFSSPVDIEFGEQGVAIVNRAVGLLISEIASNANPTRLLRNFRPGNRYIFSPDASRLAFGEQNVIYLWDTQSRFEVTEIRVEVSRLGSLIFSPDGNWLAAISDQQTVQLIHVEDQSARAISIENPQQIDFTPDSTHLLVVASESLLYSVDVNTGMSEIILRFSGSHAGYYDTLLSPDQSVIVSGKEVWDVASGQVKWALDFTDNDNFRLFGFSADGRYVIVKEGITTQYLHLIDLLDGNVLVSERTRLDTCQIDFNPQGGQASIGGLVWSSGGVGGITFWNLNTNVFTIVPDSLYTSCAPIVYTNDGSALLNVNDNRLYMRNVAALEVLKIVRFESDIYSLRFSPDGRTLLIVTAMGVIEVWGMPSNNRCFVTTDFSVNRRARPSINSEVVGNLSKADVAFARHKTIGTDGEIWWLLDDDSWVRDDVVEVSPGCDRAPLIDEN